MNPKREKEVLDTFIFYNPIMLLPSALPPKVPLSLWSVVWPVSRDPGPGGRVWPGAQSDAETSLEQRGPDSTQAVHSSSRGWTGTATDLIFPMMGDIWEHPGLQENSPLRPPSFPHHKCSLSNVIVPVQSWLDISWRLYSPPSPKPIFFFFNFDFCL